MIEAGKKFIDLMHEKGAVLVDTEMIMGDPTLGYVGQSDDTWLMLNRDKTDFGLIVTDYKSNQPKILRFSHIMERCINLLKIL